MKMNRNRIKIEIQKSPDWVGLVNKMLNPVSGEFLFIEDFRWWWDPDKNHWWNTKSAKNLMNILIEEGCLVEARKNNQFAYEKTSAFVDLLEEMLRIEEILEDYDAKKIKND